MRTIFVDNSTLVAVQSCETLSLMRYHHGWTSPSEAAALKAGLAVHEALAAFFRQGDPLQAMETFAAAYREWADGSLPPTDRLAYSNVAAIFRYWLTTHPLASFPFVVPAGMVEVGAQALLTDEGVCLCGRPLDWPVEEHEKECSKPTSVVFVGRLDAVGRRRDGPWAAVDNKTTGNISPEWLSTFEQDSQFSGYLWLLSQHLRESVLHGYVNAIELPRLPVSRGPCKKHGGVSYTECRFLHAEHKLVEVVRTEAQLVNWRQDALRAARHWVELLDAAPTLGAIHEVGQRGQWIGKCPRCDFRDWCRLGRDVLMVPAMFVQSPWVPYERVAMATPTTHQKGASDGSHKDR